MSGAAKISIRYPFSTHHHSMFKGETAKSGSPASTAATRFRNAALRLASSTCRVSFSEPRLTSASSTLAGAPILIPSVSADQHFAQWHIAGDLTVARLMVNGTP